MPHAFFHKDAYGHLSTPPMKHWTVQKIVSVGFLVVILLSVAICGFAIIRLTSIHNEALDIKTDHVAGLYGLGQLQHHTHQSSASICRLLATADPQEKAKLRAGIAADLQEIEKLIVELNKSVSAESSSEVELYTTTKQTAVPYLDICKEVLNSGKTGMGSADQEKFVVALDNFANALEAEQTYNKHDADLAATNITNDVGSTKNVVMAGSAINLLLCIIVAIVVVRMLSSTLQNLMMALIQINSSATEMAATLKEQQASANEVASTSVQIGATAKEISATTKELGKTMSDVAGVSEQTAELASGGQAGLARLDGTMRQIMGATASISGKLAILNEKTANINSMVTTINKVADQTNLLSLNAAIEAEKAGEYGQGFAVVATEIRRLADQTAVATYDIEQMVKEMQSAVSAGVMGMDKFAEEVRRGNEEVCGVTAQLVQIIQQVQALTPRFESVNDGMQMQSTAAGQISEALSQLGDTAQQSAQALRQNSEAIEQLMKAAQGLQVAAAQFKSKDS